MSEVSAYGHNYKHILEYLKRLLLDIMAGFHINIQYKPKRLAGNSTVARKGVKRASTGPATKPQL